MTQINGVTQSATNNPSLRRDLVLSITAGTAFMQAGNFSNGWLLPVLTYSIAMAALFVTLKRHSTKPIRQFWLYAISGLGCAGLVSALWFSGKMATMF